MFPKIFANCKNLGLKVPESWFRSVLVEQVPFEAACRLWDQVSDDHRSSVIRLNDRLSWMGMDTFSVRH